MISLKNFCYASLILSLLTCVDNTSKNTNSIDGSWQSIAYGRSVEVTNDEFTLYDVTNISCTPILEGDVAMFENNISVHNDTLSINDGINTYRYSRSTSLSTICTNDISDEKLNDPLYNFEVFAQNFKDHYAYFKLRGINWDSLYSDTKSKITAKTSDAELYIIFEDMIDVFNDGHLGIEASDEVMEAAEALRIQNTIEEEASETTEYNTFQVSQMVADNYLKDKKNSSNKGFINWGIMESNIAYLQINLMMAHADRNIADTLSLGAFVGAYFDSFEDMSSEEHTSLEVEGINKTLDKAFKAFNTTDALILDVRFNGGGKDEVALEIMKRFNPKKHEVFTKKAKFNEGYSKPNSVSLEASETPYTKPVFLLTSVESASATEIMVLSSLQLSHVTRVGSHTEGVFSDVLEKALPNGWEQGLSNEVYLDTKGINYEGRGIQPDIDLKYPPESEFLGYLVKNIEADKNAILETIQKHN